MLAVLERQGAPAGLIAGAKLQGELPVENTSKTSEGQGTAIAKPRLRELGGGDPRAKAEEAKTSDKTEKSSGSGAAKKTAAKKSADAAQADGDAAAEETPVIASGIPIQTAPVQVLPAVQAAIQGAGTETGATGLAVQAGSAAKEARETAPGAGLRSAGRDVKKLEVGVQTDQAAGRGTAAGGAVEPGRVPEMGLKEQPGSGPPEIAGAGVSGTVAVTAGTLHTPGGAAQTKVSESSAGLQQTAHGGLAQVADVKTLAATPSVLEVGIESGTHGWLRVRAEMGQTGEVTASMVAVSAGQADGLRRELPAMGSYLAGESVAVSALVVNAAGKSSEAMDAAMTSGGSAQQGGQLGGQRGGEDRASRPESGNEIGNGLWMPGVSESGAMLSGMAGAASIPAAIYANGSGSWLSVRV